MNTTGKVLTVVFAALACLASLAAAYYWRESSRTSFQMPYLVAIGKLNSKYPPAKPGCACRKSNPDILVMQSAEDWAAKNTPCPLHGAR